MKASLPILMLFLCFSCNVHQQINQEQIIKVGETGQQLESLLTPYVQELRTLTNNTAGLAIGITKGDQIIYARTFGYAQVEPAKKVNLNTPFHIASVSKPFSAFAIAKLIQENKINLNDLLIDHVPEFTMLGEGYDQITIEHILTHSSGIPRNIAPDDWLNPSFGPDALDENLEIVKNQNLDFKPGLNLVIAIPPLIFWAFLLAG
jgi:CubicO group peptidase (beta-lactamase class C family)